MRNNKLLFSAGLIAAVVAVIGITNSCKKDTVTPSLNNYLANYGKWRLASLYTYHFLHTPSNIKSTDTSAYACGANLQTFTFTTIGGNLCSYQYFQCDPTTYNGAWSINIDSLVLHAAILMPDTAKKTAPYKSYPFGSAQIITLGATSLVLRTGDVNSYYSDNNLHQFYRYSFIHDTTSVK